MNDYDLNKKLLQAMEESFPMPGGMGMEKPEPQESESASYTKTKRTEKGSVTISANAESMQDLHDVLKLAGITLPKNEIDSQEPVDPYDTDSDDVCDCCGKDIVDGSCGCDDHSHPESDDESAQKAVITGVLRDRLKDYLRNGR